MREKACKKVPPAIEQAEPNPSPRGGSGAAEDKERGTSSSCDAGVTQEERGGCHPPGALPHQSGDGERITATAVMMPVATVAAVATATSEGTGRNDGSDGGETSPVSSERARPHNGGETVTPTDLSVRFGLREESPPLPPPPLPATGLDPSDPYATIRCHIHLMWSFSCCVGCVHSYRSIVGRIVRHGVMDGAKGDPCNVRGLSVLQVRFLLVDPQSPQFPGVLFTHVLLRVKPLEQITVE